MQDHVPPGCIATEALGTLDSLRPDDLQRKHVASCARCGALMTAYSEFMRADAPSAARVADADTRLAAFIAARIERVESGGTSRRAGRWFQLPSIRFAAAAAALVLVALAVTRFVAPRSDDVILRGSARTVLAVDTRALAGGEIELRWTSVPEADAYEVAILSADLSEVVRLSAGSETRATIDLSSLPATAVRWQVSALREGAVIAESTPADLRE